MCNCNIKPFYVGMEVQISGLDKEYEIPEIKARVQEALSNAFETPYLQVDIEVEEHAP